MGFGCFGGFYRCGIRVDSPTQKEQSIIDEALCRDVMTYVVGEVYVGLQRNCCSVLLGVLN